MFLVGLWYGVSVGFALFHPPMRQILRAAFGLPLERKRCPKCGKTELVQ